MAEHNELGQQVGDLVVGWEPRPWPAPVTLTGQHVTVEPLGSARYADLFATTCGPDDADLWTYRPVPRPGSLAELWMHLAGLLEEPDLVPFALVPQTGPAAGKAAGIACYARIVPAHGQVEIAHVLLSRDLQRTTAATEALHLLARHALDDLGYRRLEWKCDSLNEPSRKAAARLGFTYEGRFRNHMVTQGRSRDTDWFSITDAEWPALRAAHEHWLDPGNFTADGTQRSSLRSHVAAAPS
ncbi:GNAT family N-acetyltransferase [Nocardioides sp. zg-ZUI104]|uniref:GNAT family N-acetyltransferase n=1 Tax=Nocardioides faecalis TaxID=2803858 RepID=UPI001BD19EA8|nr:GNAT family protein [Nocardioides faecalis]MBS4751489.1 GNAT family N-acetyltransferase [Nocardioides faecalis]